MSTIDLSRQATDPRKHYAGVRMQQGRVLTDDDFNEAAALDAEELRRTRVHAIGAYGSPDGGFLPANFGAVGGKVNFTLTPGHLYIGGLRLEMSAAEQFLLQKDWLNFDPALDAPSAPANGVTRRDLVWLECWQQPVTAVEDSELFEVALGGPDTSTRWRTMRRIHLAPGVAQGDCAGAWTALAGTFANLGTLNAEMELISNARMSVSFTAPPVIGDLCSPPQAGGYLGAENQAIRVQLVDATHYTWGYDNAAPLYRVQLSAQGGQLVKLTLLNQPRDAVHWPIKGQVVELLPWLAALANGERAAEVAGHLCKVAVSYNPDDHTLVLDTPVPAAFGTQWQARTDKAEFFNGMAEQNFFYLRVWNRGDDLASPASIPVANGDLGQTGLKVTFSGGPAAPGRPLDHRRTPRRARGGGALDAGAGRRRTGARRPTFCRAARAIGMDHGWRRDQRDGGARLPPAVPAAHAHPRLLQRDGGRRRPELRPVHVGAGRRRRAARFRRHRVHPAGPLCGAGAHPRAAQRHAARLRTAVAHRRPRQGRAGLDRDPDREMQRYRRRDPRARRRQRGRGARARQHRGARRLLPDPGARPARGLLALAGGVRRGRHGGDRGQHHRAGARADAFGAGAQFPQGGRARARADRDVRARRPATGRRLRTRARGRQRDRGRRRQRHHAGQHPPY
ncbi:DUF6519 domain-containing protein [Polaromonas sp. P1(28)-8]|nr:DUF6519 domain-containing protein [Polaromonas sp. P1(28)-8]